MRISCSHLNREVVASAVRETSDSVASLGGVIDRDVAVRIVPVGACCPVPDFKVTWNVPTITRVLEPANCHSVSSLPYDGWSTWRWG